MSCVSPFTSYTPAPHPHFVCTAVFEFEWGQCCPLGCKFELLVVQRSMLEKSGMYAATFYGDMCYINIMCFTRICLLSTLWETVEVVFHEHQFSKAPQSSLSHYEYRSYTVCFKNFF